MDKNMKVELTEKWWKDNQPTTLSDKGKIGPAMKKFETNWKLSINAKGPARIGCLEGAMDALAAIDTAAGKTAAACKKGIHDNAKHVLTKTLPNKTNEFRKAIKKELEAFDKKIKTLNFKTVFADKTLLNHFAVFANKNYFGENVMFLIEGRKASDKLYQKYIPNQSPYQINVSSDTQKKIIEAYENGNVKDGPWDAAYKEILQLTSRTFQSNKVNFIKYLLKQKIAF